MQDFTRRKILSTGVLALSALAAQPLLGEISKPDLPEWIVTLEAKLSLFSTRISRVLKSSGEIELHCTMPNMTAFASSHGNFGGLGLRVMAQGNRLSFKKDGFHLTAILMSPTPIRSTPA
ncbi:MAG: hypothetical protein HC767_07000 [Akkermansiaceae bacterium]|nr:hypothetical protein [Akkermansiaceae bacterium]